MPADVPPRHWHGTLMRTDPQEDDMQDQRSTSTMTSPVDDATYNLLQALTSKLEAIEAYNKYSAADTDGIFAGLISDERRHADRLLEALRSRLAAR
jgi:hypothetical protein